MKKSTNRIGMHRRAALEPFGTPEFKGDLNSRAGRAFLVQTYATKPEDRTPAQRKLLEAIKNPGMWRLDDPNEPEQVQ